MIDTTGYEQDFVDVGGERLGLAHYPEPERRGTHVTIWPAMGVPGRYYRRFAGDLLAAGFAVTVADLRGTGSSTPQASRRSRYGLADLVDDIGAVQEALAPRLAGRRTLLLGHSLGGQAALLHEAFSEHPTTDGLVLVAVGLPYFRRYPVRRAVGVLPLTQTIAAASAVLRVWPGWGFGGRQARGVIRDWGYTARHGRYPRLGGIDAEAALRTVTTPVLAISVDDDQYTPTGTVDHLVGKLTKAPVTRTHYDTATAGARLDHFIWTRAGGPLATRIAEFADELPGR